MDACAAQILARIEQGGDESPQRLRERAAELMADYGAALAALPRLVQEVALLRGRAGALEQADLARAALAEADAAVAAAEEVYEATAGPEQEAARAAVHAHQVSEGAREAVARAADPAEEADLETAAIAAARVDQRRLQELARTQEARVLSKRARDAARARLARAREALEAAEATVDAPMAAPRPAMEQVQELALTWTYRLAMRNEPGWELTEPQLGFIRSSAAGAADAMNVVPDRLAWQIAAAVARQSARGAVGAEFKLPFTAVETTIAELLKPGR